MNGRNEHTVIYKTRVGSHAYGMNTPTSDEDFAGIFVPAEEYFFGLKAFDQQIEQSKERDTTLYSLRKFANLAIANNPNVMELLFVNHSDVILADPIMWHLRYNRDSFLSQKCASTYVGYAQAQLHRIRSHQKWIAQEFEAIKVLEPLVRQGKISRDWVAWRFGENMVKRLEPFVIFQSMVQQDQYLEQLKGLGIVCPSEQYQKHLYDMAKKQRDQYVTWMAERNPHRREMEVKFGYDTKHGAHLVRLLRTGYEILTEGKCHVRRPDAAELLAIRQGSWSYEQITTYADEMITKVNSLTEFAVPKTPDYDLINSLIIKMTKEVLAR